MIALKRVPNALEDWLATYHPYLSGQVHFLEGTVVAQNDLNPFKARIIVIYTATVDRYHLKGWLNYGEEDTVSPMTSLPKSAHIPIPKALKRPEGELTMDLVMDRIDWIIFNGPKRPFDEAFMVLQHIGPYVPEFYQLLMSKELANFKVEYETEEDIAHFLQRYGLSKSLQLMGEPPTLQDVQRVWHQWRPAKEPVVWILLPMEEGGQGMDLYPGGYYHATLFDIAAHWVWKHLTHRAGKRRTVVHPEQMRLLIDHIQQRLADKKRFAQSGGKGPIERPSEDRLPPCVRSILCTAKRFPQDRERQLVVRVLSAANVSLEYVRDKLEELNDRYPHGDGRKSAKARWDYEYHYKAKYQPPSCRNMGEMCPFGGSLDQKKMACCKMFSGDNKPRSAKEFKGPANWFDW